MCVEKIPFQIANSSGDVIAGDVRIENGGKASFMPVVIIAHGFTAFKDWGSVPYIAEQFALQGFCAVTFNFSHNGVRGDAQEFNAPEMFAANTISIELDDMFSLVGAVRERTIPAFDRGDGGNIFLLGHSRGAGIAIITAREQPFIRGLAACGSPARFEWWSARLQEEWRAAGYREVQTHQPKGTLRLSTALLDDMDENAERFNLRHNVARLRSPLLLIHGNLDLTVPVAAALKLYDSSNPMTTRLHILQHTGHTFGARHPFNGPSAPLTEAIVLTADFFRSHIDTEL